MKSNTDDPLEKRSREDRENYQFHKLRNIIDLAKSKSEGWKTLLKDVDASQIKEKKDLSFIPITRKSLLSKAQVQEAPFGGLTTKNYKKFDHIFASPGPIYEPGGSGDFWRMSRAMKAASFGEGDVMYNTFSYHLTPAGFMMDQAARSIGISVIPGGIGNTELQLRTISELRPNRYVGTPSFLKIILEKGNENNIDVSCLKTGLVGGEACPPSLRKLLSQLGCEVLQSYGTADLGLVAYESWDKEGMFCDEEVILEIVKPGSDKILEDGEVGEIVVTTLNEDYPLFRFATGDLSAVITEKSRCGRTATRIKGWMGRADQTTKVRGMFVRPEQIANIENELGFKSKLRLLVDSKKHEDVIKMLVETDTKDVTIENIKDKIRAELKLRAEVELVSMGTIPNDGIVIEDKRTFE